MSCFVLLLSGVALLEKLTKLIQAMSFLYNVVAAS